MQPFLRNADADTVLESFLVSAIAAILGVRFYLALTNYPQLGGGGLHIAHMLWGGLLMLIAIILTFSFLGNHILKIAAIIGGIGFGLFIDEIGKFVTADNNYFFEPAVALMYVIFVLIYLSTEAIQRRTLTPQEYLANALVLTKDAIIHDLDTEEKERALTYLQHARGMPLAVPLQHMLQEIKPIDGKTGWLGNLKTQIHTRYIALIRKSWFARAIIYFFIAYSLVNVGKAINLGIGRPALSFSEWGEIACAAFSGTLVLIGIAKLRSSRRDAFVSFKYAVLVGIFLTQFFAFMNNQFFALIGLAANITILITLHYALREEEHVSAGTSYGQAARAKRPSS